MKKNKFLLAVIIVSLLSICSLGAQNVNTEQPGHCTIKIGDKALQADTHAILIPEKATPQESYAAEELQHHLKLLTGQSIPILKDNEACTRNFLVVGKSSMLEKLKVNVDWKSLGKEGIFIKTAGSDLVIAGGERGVLYACYTLLEEFLGVRWFTRDCLVFPKEGTFDLSSIEKKFVPSLEYREVYTYAAFNSDGNSDWAVRNKLNGRKYRLDAKRGGVISYAGPFVHSFDFFVPPAKYFKEHPEYFSEIKGQRKGEKAQLCLTNPDVENIVVEGVRNLLKKSPTVNIVSVSQNDTEADYCQCAKCKLIDEEEGSPSGSLLRFVNRVAERIEKEYPDVAIDTLAYNYSRKPPKITKPRPNVIVRIGNTPCSFSQPIETGEQNRACCQDIEGWGKICKRIYVWDYVTNFHHYLRPHPNLRVLKPNVQFFIKNGIKGLMAQGNGSSPGGESDELRTWLLAKLFWNPDADTGSLINEFLAGYYGAASPYLRQYIDLMHDSVEKTKTYLGMYGYDVAGPFLTPEVLAKSDELFDKAEEAVRLDPILLKRIQTARLPILYMHIAGNNSWRQEGDMLLSNSNKTLADVEKFEKIAKAAKVTHTKEGTPNIEQWIAAAKVNVSGLSIKHLKNPVLEVDIVPETGGRIWRMKYLPSGKEVIKPYGSKTNFQVDRNGYEEYSTNGYRSAGWNEKYEIKECTETKLLLTAELKNGYRMERFYELDPVKACLNITSTLTNKDSKARQSCFRIHPAFSVANVQKATLKTKLNDGSWSQCSLSNPEDRLAEKGTFFENGKDLPCGEWMVVDNTDDITLTNKFQPSEISKCYVNWNGRENRVNLEMWSAAVNLKPGESMVVHHSYEVIKTAKTSPGK